MNGHQIEAALFCNSSTAVLRGLFPMWRRSTRRSGPRSVHQRNQPAQPLLTEGRASGNVPTGVPRMEDGAHVWKIDQPALVDRFPCWLGGPTSVAQSHGGEISAFHAEFFAKQIECHPHPSDECWKTVGPDSKSRLCTVDYPDAAQQSCVLLSKFAPHGIAAGPGGHKGVPHGNMDLQFGSIWKSPPVRASM